MSSGAAPSLQRALTAWPFRIRPAHRHNEKQDLSHRQRLSRCSSTPNTRMVQTVLAEPKWRKKPTDADRRGLSALFWTHLNLYGKFELDMRKQLDLGPDLAGPNLVPGPKAKVGQP
ncbi:Tn3 family transposase [Streptosporangium sp. NPDC005286]|uniref:Tn3 family transposase n=1 Tax=Streptosporangium sp. NPDC005286 TaxID=3154463 RepID=UPI0033BC220F